MGCVCDSNHQPTTDGSNCGLQCPAGAHDDGPSMGCVCDSNHQPTIDGSNCGSAGNGPMPTMTPPWMSSMMPAGVQCPPGAHDEGPGCVCDSNHEPTTDGSNCG